MAATGNRNTVVIGAGHNGLVAACLLARRGRRVTVVERRDVAGGLCAGEEFHPGYRHAGLLQDTACLRRNVVDELALYEHGLELTPPTPVFVPTEEGGGLLLAHDPDAAAEEIAKHSARDAQRYREFHAFIARVRGVVEPLVNDIPPDLTGPDGLGFAGALKLGVRALAARRLGRADLMEFSRVPPMCVADWLNEWFETDALKVALAQRAVAGTWCGPWSPGTAANLLLHMCTAHRSVLGGGAALVTSLERAARNLGVEVRMGAAVRRIVVEGGAATGVELDGGETIAADAVVSSCDPKTTLLDLLRPGDIDFAPRRRIEQFRARGTTAAMHLALSKPLEFAARPAGRVERAATGENLDFVERAFDAVKYRRFSQRPSLEIAVPSLARGDRAGAGGAVVSVLVHFAPYDLDGGWNDGERERLGDAVLAELERVAPGTGAAVVGREVLTPADIEARYGIAGGHIHHGEHSLDQLLVRPTIDAARYRTPVAGLFLCGAGTHPGGGVTGACGAIAAGVVDAS